MADRAGSKLVASMPHTDGAVAAGLAGCALVVVVITTQTCFAALFPSACLQVKGASVEIQNSPIIGIMGNLIDRCFAGFRKLFISIPAKNTPDKMVATNTDREIRLQAIRAKIRSLEEADVKQTQLLNFLHSDAFRDQFSNKILNMTRGHLVDGFGEKQNESQESRIEKLKEEREVLLEEDKKVSLELQKTESESARLREVLRQKRLDVEELRCRVLQKRGVKVSLEEENSKNIHPCPGGF